MERVEISKEEIPGSKRSMHGNTFTYSGFKGRTFKPCVLIRWDFNFCVLSSPLRGPYNVVKVTESGINR